MEADDGAKDAAAELEVEGEGNMGSTGELAAWGEEWIFMVVYIKLAWVLVLVSTYED